MCASCVEISRGDMVNFVKHVALMCDCLVGVVCLTFVLLFTVRLLYR